jgi:hypothetical protein
MASSRRYFAIIDASAVGKALSPPTLKRISVLEGMRPIR